MCPGINEVSQGSPAARRGLKAIGMCILRRIHLTICIVVCFTSVLEAQTDIGKKVKLYDTWITVKNNAYPARGVLYEIKDSSIILSNSRVIRDYPTNNFALAEINFSNINYVNTRRTGKVTRGAIIGGTIFGIVTTAAIISMDEDIPAYYYITLGTTFALAGSGIGAIIGSIKSINPINGDIANFVKVRPRLEKLSYVSEPSRVLSTSESDYQHRSYIAMLLGPSIPLGDLADKSGAIGSGGAKSGYISDVVNIGFRIAPKFGITAVGSYSQYEVDDEIPGKWWGLGGITVGPMFSVPVGNKMYLDLKPRIGFSGAQLQIDETILEDGNGLAFDLNASLLFNFSRRWCVITEGGYFYTHQKFMSGSEMNIQSLNLALGVGYRFR